MSHDVPTPDVSIVIVSMNQPKRLEKCLCSLYAQSNRATVEIWVVAYRFSRENLVWLRKTFPDVNVLVSEELRGFSENNNLALRKARGRYAFLLNDDTWMDAPVVDALVQTFCEHADAAVVLPKILNADGSTQYCGAPPFPLTRLFFSTGRKRPAWKESRWVKSSGVFQTHDIVGAAFMARMDIFRELGFLDEQYFFTPEDIAYSSLVNERGWACYVNATVHLFHEGSASLKRSFVPCIVAMHRGCILYFGRHHALIGRLVALSILVRSTLKWIYWLPRRGENAMIHREMWRAAVATVFSRRTPKELFADYSKRTSVRQEQTT